MILRGFLRWKRCILQRRGNFNWILVKLFLLNNRLQFCSIPGLKNYILSFLLCNLFFILTYLSFRQIFGRWYDIILLDCFWSDLDILITCISHFTVIVWISTLETRDTLIMLDFLLLRFSWGFKIESSCRIGREIMLDSSWSNLYF